MAEITQQDIDDCADAVDLFGDDMLEVWAAQEQARRTSPVSAPEQKDPSDG